MKDIVLYVFSAFMIVAFLFGLIGAYFGLRLLLYVGKNYPKKLPRLIFSPTALRALEKEIGDKDLIFIALKQKMRKAQKISIKTVISLVFLVLTFLFIAFIFGSLN